MVCIYCGLETQVINSRLQKRSNRVWRRRQCLGCGAVFTTEEAADYGAAWVVRGKTGVLQPFSRDKLFMSLYISCGHRPAALKDAGALTETVITKLAGRIDSSSIDSRVITQVALVALTRFDKAAAAQYQAFHKA